MTNTIARKIAAAAVMLTVAASTLSATSAHAAGQCGARVSVSGLGATGLVYKLKKQRAERRAKRAWRGYVAGERGASIFAEFTNTNHSSYGLGTRYADLGKAKNVVVNCKGGGKMYCTVTATPCTTGYVEQTRPAPRTTPTATTYSTTPADVVLAPSGPDLNRAWNSDFGPIHWKQGFYGNPNKTLTGRMTNRNGTMVYEGHWGRRDSAARGAVRFVFSPDGKRFAGTYRASNGSTKTWNGFR